MNSPVNWENELNQVIAEVHNQQALADIWSGSTYHLLDLLKNDYSGKVGERFMVKLAQKLNLPYKYEEDKNSSDGTYDIIINSKKIEVKTAREGASEKGEGHGNHQHESLRKDDDCDYYAFIDIGPNIIHLTFLSKGEMVWDKKHSILKVTPHLRRKTIDQYKFDLSQAALKRAIAGGLCLQVDKNTSEQKIVNFFRDRGII
jgi:hypothetical protein